MAEQDIWVRLQGTMAGRKYNVAVVGARGLVGSEMLKILAERISRSMKYVPMGADKVSGSGSISRADGWR